MTAETPWSSRTAVVTGGASGIGRATALALAARGTSVAVLDKDAGSADEVAARITTEGPGTGLSVPCDLSRVGEIRSCVDRIAERLGPIDILVNCAGIVGPRVGLADITEDIWDSVHAINLKAAVFVTQAVVPHMTAGGRRGGNIVNVSSASAHRAVVSSHPYASSKAALESLTRTLAGELAPHEINVNAVAPGVTATAIYGENDDDEARTARARQGPTANLFGRFSQPADIAATIVFLCAPESRQITGQVVHVSAGAVV